MAKAKQPKGLAAYRRHMNNYPGVKAAKKMVEAGEKKAKQGKTKLRVAEKKARAAWKKKKKC